ncbi:MAG TPA: rod shape-determining protein MreC [Candidatus Limnocylindria bacterium]|nr:rod shape-determining protein MreC [Candidatus Limnocylindria bacterium]
MSALLASKSVRRRGAAYIALVVVSILLMTVSSNPLVRELQHGVAFAFKPIQVAADGIARSVSSIATTIAEIDGLRQENAALRAENEQLEAESRAATEVRRENELLTGLLQLREGLQYQTRAVAVIARDSSEARQSVVIDRGADADFEVGMVVITAGGALAGRITEVGPNFAHVLLLNDATTIVVGQLVSSATTGKVSGTGQARGELLMKDVDATAKVETGEEVFTAGIQLGEGIRSPYPKGLLIGRVVAVTQDPNEVVQTAFLEPAAPLDRLEFLLVITDYEGGIIGPIETGVPCDPTDGGTLPDSDQPCATEEPDEATTPKP